MPELWRTAAPVVTDKGVTIGGMWGHQRQWWELPNFVKALVTGYGGGKTFIGGKRAISLALHNGFASSEEDTCAHLVVSPSYKVARRTTIPTIKVLLSGKERLLPGFSWKYHKTNHEFDIYYRGRRGSIWIQSGDDPDSLRGPNVGSAWIDEPFIQDEDVLNQVLARVRHPRSRKLEVDLTGTPEELNWGYDICEGDRADDYDIGVIHASTRDNKALAEDYANRLESGLTEKAAEAYVKGQFVSLQTGQIYYAFSRFENVKDLPDPGGELFVGNDFNVNPMAAVVAWVREDHVHVMEEIELPNADTAYLCGYVTEKYRYKPDSELGKTGCRVSTFFPDASGSRRSTNSPGGRSDFHFIRDAGFRIEAPPSNPHIRDRENAVNGKLCSSKSKKRTLTISPRCKRLISYLTKLTHENKNTPTGKKMTHLTDGLGYLIHRLFPIVRDTVRLSKVSGA